MRKDQYELLMKAAEENAYMSIAVNSDGAPVSGGSVPWERTVSAFNMKTPKLTVSAADLQDGPVLDALKRCILVGCYIFVPLPDYSFISGFREICDLYILHGESMRDLSFLRGLDELFMFYLEGASLPDLRPLIDVCNGGNSAPGKCFGFCNCDIADTSSLSEIGFVLSELLIWPVAGDQADRWTTSVRPGVFRFYGPAR